MTTSRAFNDLNQFSISTANKETYLASLDLYGHSFFFIEKWKSKDYFIDVLEARFKAV